jgi:hypothetical protein
MGAQKRHGMGSKLIERMKVETSPEGEKEERVDSSWTSLLVLYWGRKRRWGGFVAAGMGWISEESSTSTTLRGNKSSRGHTGVNAEGGQEGAMLITKITVL